MTIHTITSIVDGRTLYSGSFKSFRLCLEQAVRDEACLDHADLRQANLLNAMLDGARLRGAVLAGACLAGANLSEAMLDHASFAGACMTGAVLCESSLRNAHFEGVEFGGTLIDSALLDGAHFSSLSSFTLDYVLAASQNGCLYYNPCGTICPMGRPPLVIRGLAKPLILLDRHMKIGHAVIGLGDAHALPDPQIMRLRLEQVVARHRQNAA